MCSFTTDFDRAAAGYSPDRVDALVWALSELIVEHVPYDGLMRPMASAPPPLPPPARRRSDHRASAREVRNRLKKLEIDVERTKNDLIAETLDDLFRKARIAGKPLTSRKSLSK
jgi:hypothetical protein